MPDAKISALSAGGVVLPTDQFAIARSGGSYSVLASQVSLLELVYRYTVTGAVKASIDTGVDTPDAGTNDWTNGDLLEVWLYARGDVAALQGTVLVTANNLTTAIYDRQYVLGAGSTASAGNALAQTSWAISLPGSTANAGAFGSYRFSFPNFTNTVGNKVCEATGSLVISTAASTQALTQIFALRDTGALTRLKFAGSGTNFAIGSQLLIYKRRRP